MAGNEKWLVVAAAGLGWKGLARSAGRLGNWSFAPLRPVFPAVTCTAQASFRTAAEPARHDMPGNGFLERRLGRVFFWEQSARLVRGPRIWDRARDAGKRVAMLFWQQSLGESVDVLLSPKPIHKHHGGMIQDCYSQPDDLYEKLCRKIGRPFNLMHYWGPLASRKSSEWITEATSAIMEDESLRLDIVFTYIPHLDYDLQRYGPESSQARRALEVLADCLRQLVETAERKGWAWLIWGDYAMETVSGGAIFPNRLLREAGAFRVRRVNGCAYPDLYHSTSFAVTDHQVAHVYVRDERTLKTVRDMFEKTDGVAAVLDRDAQAGLGAAAPSGGELLLVATQGRWFAYPWWCDRREEPDYASHVDIHNKPGYDPCELFWGWPPGAISRNVNRVRGTHGRVNSGLETAWACSTVFETRPRTLIELAAELAKRL